MLSHHLTADDGEQVPMIDVEATTVIG